MCDVFITAKLTVCVVYLRVVDLCEVFDRVGVIVCGADGSEELSVQRGPASAVHHHQGLGRGLCHAGRKEKHAAHTGSAC